MIRKYHNRKPQTTPWHREEEPLNRHETPGRQIKQSNQISLPHQNDYNTRMDISNVQQNIEQLQTLTMEVIINKSQQQQNHCLRTDSSLSHRGLYAFNWYQIFALDSAVFEVQEMFSSYGGHLTNAVYHLGETLVKLTHHDETKKRAHDSQIVRAKENLKFSHGGSSYR